jgi:hypothetical protein
MAKDRIEVSVQEELANVGRAIERVTRAAFAGAPGAAAKLRARKKTAQFSFRVRSSAQKKKIESTARRKILNKIFAQKAVQIENAIRKALEAVIVGLVGVSGTPVKVLGRTLGNARPKTDIDDEPFARFIKSPAGAGEIGLPDPDESLRNLKIALLKAIRVDVVVRARGPQVKFVFDQRRLLALTPHPDRFEGGATAPFFSWLSLVTGPDFLTGGTPQHAMVRASDIKAKLSSMSSNAKTFGNKASQSRGLKRAQKLEGLFQVSRTRDYAGNFAAIMLSTQRKTGKSPAEALGGKTASYRPGRQFVGFWDKWWLRTKIDLGVWTRRVMFAAVRAILKGGV